METRRAPALTLAWALALALDFGLPLAATAAESTGTVKQDRVNVRGAASLVGEVITQLKRGETVTILETLEVAKPRPGEPKTWLKIKLPPNTPVWLHADYIDPTDKTVKPNRLNLRAGPGENYSVIGRIEKGTVVKEIRSDGSWMEVEAPDGTYAFVAGNFIETGAAATPEASPVVTDAPPAAVAATPPPTPVQVPVDATPVPPPGAEAPRPTALPGDAAPVAAAAPATAPAPTETVVAETRDEPLPKRIVTREGVIFRTVSIQAPTPYGIENMEDGRTMNYLSTRNLDIKLDNFRGRKVRVTGEEKMDRRWRSVPLLEVETLRLIE